MNDPENESPCAGGGRLRDGLAVGHSFDLPDEVQAIPAEDRPRLARCTADLCQLGERRFVRCMLEIPFTQREGCFVWGLWAEVAREDFLRYVAGFERDASGEPPLRGHLANAVPVHASVIGLPVIVRLGISTERPTLHFPRNAFHPFAQEQRRGIDELRHREILRRLGRLA